MNDNSRAWLSMELGLAVPHSYFLAWTNDKDKDTYVWSLKLVSQPSLYVPLCVIFYKGPQKSTSQGPSQDPFAGPCRSRRIPLFKVLYQHVLFLGPVRSMEGPRKVLDPVGDGYFVF